MNIAIFASAFHPHLGGVEELVRQLAHELRRRGHGVIILTNRWPRNLPTYEDFEGLPVYRLPFRTSEDSVKSKLSYHFTHRRILRETLRILDRHAIDVMHVQCVSSNALYALRAREQRPRPLVVTLQGELTMDATGLFERSMGARETLRRALLEADVVTGCSAKTVRDAEEFLGAPVKDSTVVFNAALIEDFRVAQPWVHSRPYIFAIGRLVPQKGFDLLIQSFAEANVASHDLIVAGEGPERADLEELVRRLGLSGRVHLPGRADRPMVARYFKGCQFLVLPSRADEGLPVVCAEGMAAGKAIIATRSGGAPEAVLHGETGLIVERCDGAALAAAIRKLCQAPELRRAFGEAGAARASEFSWPVITEQYLRVYERSLAASARGAGDPSEVLVGRGA
ncbi:MAG TPA: glycosyltransferase family 4 protein [Chthoniobacter sp.]|nr:glycosyltransferase family 4 protein [Chthoniobacter sp.]